MQLLVYLCLMIVAVNAAKDTLGGISRGQEDVTNIFEGVKELTTDNWNDHVGSDTAHFVQFYTPWCHHCTNLIEIWARLGENAKKTGIDVAKVNCNEHKKIALRHKVEAYPTLMYFGPGEKVGEPYTGTLKEADLMRFLKSKTGTPYEEPPPQGVPTVQEPEGELSEEEKLKQDRLDEESKRLRHEVLQNMKEGVHYFADYDISTVEMDPMPEPKEGEKLWFKWMDPEWTKWEFAYVSNKPRVAFIPEFLSEEETQQIIAEANLTIAPAGVHQYTQRKLDVMSDVRTSSSTWLNPSKSPLARRIINRILDLIGFSDHPDIGYGAGPAEHLQVLRYYPGQKYNAHHDYADPVLYGPQTTNRAVTVFLYLSDVEKGGETAFPRADGKANPPNLVDCHWGLRVRPLKRAAAVFYGMTPLGKLEPYSLHTGCAVEEGVKWGAPLWIRLPVGGV